MPAGPPAGRRGYVFSADEVAFLTSAAGQDALSRARAWPLTATSLLADLDRARKTAGRFGPAVVETAALRRRAVEKLGPPAANWLLTEESLQQATPGAVARHRADRLRLVGVHDLTCSVGADLAALIRARSGPAVVGSDLDPIRLAMARWNLGAAGLPAPLFRADALTRTTRGLLGYADPARRDTSGRRITTADTIPSVVDLDRVHADRPPVLRLPPGIDYQGLGRPGETEIVSLDGSVREAVLWPAELAGPSRRATMLRTDFPAETVTSDDPDDCPVQGVGDLIVEPDGAVIRAGLVRHWGARHRLGQLDAHLAYLTGPTAPPGHRGFRVHDEAAYSERTVADWIRRDGVGTVEIKQRGTALIPDDLRARLRKVMSRDTRRAATLIVARIGSAERAFWCHAESPR